MSARTVIVLVALVLAVGACTIVHRSTNVDLRENKAIVGTNRVTDLRVSPR